MTQKMDPEVKAKWLEALRSGEYTQGRLTLHNRMSNEYCCLGVLCHVQDPESLDNMPIATMRAEKVPDKFAAGLTHVRQRHLAKMNDKYKNFNFIADYIEENY